MWWEKDRMFINVHITSAFSESWATKKSELQGLFFLKKMRENIDSVNKN